ncbi:MAG: endonuclease III [Clostridiales bacterium]|nr:endonuclease III [Clostridiales bacterium]
MPVQKKKILQELAALYPNPKSELHFSNPYETLVATILSAQCTDVRVNMVTPAVFRDFPTVEAMAAATPEILYPYVKSCGFKSKATNIVHASRIIVDQYQSTVPTSMEELTSLPGVGQKTANVVRANAFQIPSFAVDTHVFRVSNRLGLANAKTVEKTEEQLKVAVPKKDWIDAHHWLILHGRRVCSARSPKCTVCTLNPYCKYYKTTTSSTKKG